LNPVFALLDDTAPNAHRTEAESLSRLYTGFVREHRSSDPASLDAVCEAVQADLAGGLHGVLLADYEWGAKLLGAGHAKLKADDHSCLRVLMFAQLQRLDGPAVADWLAQQEGQAEPAPAGTLGLQAEVTREAYEAAIARIHEAIRCGETYQVNYTYRLRGQVHGAPLALYRRLRARQAVSFGALIHLPMQPGDEVEWVLSRSPELMVRHTQGRLQTRPMKGTAARSQAPEGDSETARLLHADTKNRAENLMIVDLLRNDIGRIALTGSVKVPELFRIEPYATVFQMTSTIEAQRRPEVGLAGLLRAVFPCGSITGAPKHRTMEWIAALETSPRDLYTGAIGWLEGQPATTTADAAAPAADCPDLCLSVAIRTLALGPERAASAGGGGGLRDVELGVGGGIVLDSVAADEWEETRWKARFLTALDPGFALFETMRATHADGVAWRDRHRARLAASARQLGFAFDAQGFDALLDRCLALADPSDGPLRLRVALQADGRLALTHAPLAELAELLAGQPVRLLLADAPLPAARPLAAHKTTLRAEYDAGIARAQAAGAFDTLFFNADGALVEGGRSNLLLKLRGRWFTPPLSDGVLPGVMRGVLMDDPAWQLTAKRLTLDDLRQAEALVVCNALRGALPAVLAAPGDDAPAPSHAQPNLVTPALAPVEPAR
jgi:para-aminobenzoate synthetase/4-amino-4-deoxychorismate lyase